MNICNMVLVFDAATTTNDPVVIHKAKVLKAMEDIEKK
jgi:hypothetical protein